MMMRFSSTTFPLIGTGIICLWVIGVVSLQRQHLNPLTYAMLASESSAELPAEVDGERVKQTPVFETNKLTIWIQKALDGEVGVKHNPFFSEALNLKLNPPPPPPPPPPEKKEEEKPKPKPEPPPPPKKVKLFFHGVMSSDSGGVMAWITLDDARLITVNIGDPIEGIPYLIADMSRSALLLTPTEDAFDPVSIDFNQSVTLEIPVK
jgi:hypothetical protein